MSGTGTIPGDHSTTTANANAPEQEPEAGSGLGQGQGQVGGIDNNNVTSESMRSILSIGSSSSALLEDANSKDKKSNKGKRKKRKTAAAATAGALGLGLDDGGVGLDEPLSSDDDTDDNDDDAAAEQRGDLLGDVDNDHGSIGSGSGTGLPVRPRLRRLGHSMKSNDMMNSSNKSLGEDDDVSLVAHLVESLLPPNVDNHQERLGLGLELELGVGVDAGSDLVAQAPVPGLGLGLALDSEAANTAASDHAAIAAASAISPSSATSLTSMAMAVESLGVPRSALSSQQVGYRTVS